MMTLPVAVTRVVADLPTLSLAPVFPVWLLVPGLLLVVALSIYLYVEQRRVASPATVFLLTLLRAGLIAMVAVLFLQPSLKWFQSQNSAGTLWLVVDQSPSMQTVDPQATPAERLRWAQAIGAVPDDGRAARPGTMRALVHALAGEFASIEPLNSGADEHASIQEFSKRLAAWSGNLDKAARSAADSRERLNGLARNSGNLASEALERAHSLLLDELPQIRESGSLRQAASILDSFAINRALQDADNALAAAAARDDDRALGGDIGAGIGNVANVSRSGLAFDFLAGPDAKAAGELATLAKKYHIRIASFADKTQAAGIAGGLDAAAIPETLKSALSPAGQATSIESALQYVSEQTASDEAASVIILSDGRNNVPGDPTGPARNLAARGVHVYGLLVGSHEVSPDAAVEQVDAPDWVYKGDTVKARALVRLDGLQGRTALIELRRGETVLDRRSVRATRSHQTEPIEFSDKPPESTKALEYQVRVAEMPGEVNTQNNVSSFRISIKKDKLYALIIDDRPRWEYRYLSAALARDPRLKIQTVLFNPAQIVGIAPPAATRAAPENPLLEAQMLPETAAEWEAFDIVVLGDIAPDLLPPQSQQFIAAAVRDKGTTLITIAGQRSMPAKFANSQLAEILPVTMEPQYSPDNILRHTLRGFRPGVAPAAGASVLTQFEVDSGANAVLWSHVGPWYWHSPFTQVKPAASAIWTINEFGPPPPPSGPGAGGEDGNPLRSLAAANSHALLSTMNVGLGRSLFLASDQTWRLRQVNGENIHERFWGQVLRWAVGSDLPAGGKYVRFGANQPIYSQDQPVTVTARILRDDLTPYTGLAFSAVARAAQGGEAASQPSAAHAVEARFTPMESPGYYTATLGGLPVGEVEISLKGAEVERLLDGDPTVTQRTLLVKIEPTMNAERRNMNTDPALLETIARAGGGYALDAADADLLLSRLPEIRHTETSASQLGFFTDPAALGTRVAHWGFLGLFAVVLTAEWLLRKRAGLV
jgi:hypothetical protein